MDGTSAIIDKAMGNPLVTIGIVVGVVAVLVVIFMISSGKSSDTTSSASTEPAATAPSEPVQTNRVELARKDAPKNFFNSGMGFLQGKNKEGIESAYRDFMVANSGSGILRLNKNQIGQEIKRITEDRAANFLKEVAGQEEARWDTKAGPLTASIDEQKTLKQSTK